MRISNTLAYANTNYPYATLNEKIKILDIKLKRLEKYAKKLDIFTDKNKINIHSNGIKDVFRFAQDDKTVHSEGKFVIAGGVYYKKNSANIGSSSPLNLDETITEMKKKSFLPRDHMYGEILSYSNFQLSNLIPLSKMHSQGYIRTSLDVSLKKPTITNKILIDKSIIDRDTMDSELLPIGISIPILSLEKDSVENINAGNIICSNLSFKDGYVPVDPKEQIPNRYAQSSGYEVESQIDSLYVYTPKNGKTPINKETMESLSGSFIDESMAAVSINIDRGERDISNDSVLSYNEAEMLVDDLFSSIINPTISNIDQFKEYMSPLCEANEDFLSRDFSISGGKIYLGFDYDNMNSIFNNEALSNIVGTLGAIESGHGVTYRSYKYFRDQELIDKLSAYAQRVSCDFDISIDTIGQVIYQIKRIVAKLCSMSPDIVQYADDPFVVPQFKAEIIIVQPVFPGMYISYLEPFVQTPIYNKELKFFIVSPPNFYISSVNPYQKVEYIKPPFYAKNIKVSMVSQPSFNTNVVSYESTTLDKPSNNNSQTTKSFSRRDGVDDRLALFSVENQCRKRYSARSTRTINMLEVGVVLGKLRPSGFFWSSKSDGLVMSAPAMAVSLLSDIMCRVAEKTEYYMNVDIKLLDKSMVSSDGSGNAPISKTSGCVGDYVDSSSTVPEKIISIFEDEIFSVNGITISGDGSISGTQMLYTTELVSSSLVDAPHVPEWTEFGSNSYLSIVEQYATALSESILSYIKNIRLDDWNSIEQTSLVVGSLGNLYQITDSDEFSDAASICLLEYIKTTHGVLGNLDGDKNELGIAVDSVPVYKSIADLVYPYDNILIGAHAQDDIVDRVAYMDNPPAMEKGEDVVYIWMPNMNSTVERIENIPHIKVSSMNKGVVSSFEPIVFIKKDRSGRFQYDIACAYDNEVESTTIDVPNPMGITRQYTSLRYMNKNIILGEATKVQAPNRVAMPRDLCDPWESPYQLYGVVGAGDSGLESSGGMSRLISGMRQDSRRIENIQIHAEGGCDSGVDGIKSGIDTKTASNISSLADIYSGSQEKGDVQGAIKMNMSMALTKATHSPSGEEIVQSGSIKLCLVFGVIDGFSNEHGDILSQGLTQEEIDATEGDAVTYVSPNEKQLEHTTIERKKIGDKDASVYTVGLTDMLAIMAVETSTGEPFVDYINSDGEMETGTIILSPGSSDQAEKTAIGEILVGDYRSSGMSFFYKHSGQDPSKPIVQGYQGSSEVDFIGGDRLVGTIPSPLPNTTVTYEDSADEFMETIDATDNQVHIFINNENMQVLIPDSKATFSENRDVKVVWEVT